MAAGPRAEVVAASSAADFGPVRGEHSGEFLRLSRLWEKRSHHSLIFAAVDIDTYRDALIARLDALGPVGERLELVDGERPSDWLCKLANLAAARPAARRLHVVLAPDCHPDAAWWREANTLRERLADAFPWLLAFWAPDATITAAAREAPDLWNWRETVCDFILRPAAARIELASPAFSSDSDMDAEVVRLRLDEIDAYLQEHGDGAAAAHLLLEAAAANQRLGQLDVAEALSVRAVACFTTQNNDAMLAQAHGQIADILQARGRLDEALAVWRDAVLPVFERVGYVREAEIARERIRQLETRRADSGGV